ncbi:MAG: CotH kinase family protein [Saprospiraceae bacterium]
MKRYLLLLAMTCLCQWSNAQNDGDHLFDQSYLHEIRFESPLPNFFDTLVQIFDDSAFFFEIPYLPGTVIIDGHKIDSVGIRIKGGLSSFANKKPFKVDFNEFVPGLNYDKVKKFNLQNADGDASVQREAIAYEIFRSAGVKAPRTAFAKVYVNNDYHGVYIMVEQLDKNFLRNYFADDEGILYKNKTCELEVASGEEDYSHAEQMFGIASGTTDAEFILQILQSMDTEAFLRYMLLENFLNAVDNPIQVDCNYYLYHSHLTDLITWIPWDFNYALFPFVNYPLIHLSANGNALYQRMQQIQPFRDQYLNLACHFLEYLFVENDLHEMIDKNAALIRDAVELDPRIDFTIAEFDAEVQALKTLMTNRINQYHSDLDQMGFTCNELQPVPFQAVAINEIIASNDSLSGIADPAGGFADWVELYNNTDETVSLENCYLSDDRDFLKRWRFPQGSSIAAGEYLIVWADRDINEDGLHTNFKLSKDGGDLFLLFENNQMIDSISYGPQSTNIPFARFPNGTGPFIFHQSTFGENNALLLGYLNPINTN